MFRWILKPNYENSLSNLWHAELLGLHDESMEMVFPLKRLLNCLPDKILELGIEQARNILRHEHTRPYCENGLYK